jgi:hypothetical protein
MIGVQQAAPQIEPLSRLAIALARRPSKGVLPFLPSCQAQRLTVPREEALSTSGKPAAREPLRAVGRRLRPEGYFFGRPTDCAAMIF